MNSDNRCVVWVLAVLAGGIVAIVLGYNMIATYEITEAIKAGYEQKCVYTPGHGNNTIWVKVEDK